MTLKRDFDKVPPAYSGYSSTALYSFWRSTSSQPTECTTLNDEQLPPPQQEWTSEWSPRALAAPFLERPRETSNLFLHWPPSQLPPPLVTNNDVERRINETTILPNQDYDFQGEQVVGLNCADQTYEQSILSNTLVIPQRRFLLDEITASSRVLDPYSAELILNSTTTRQAILVPSCSPTAMMDSPPRSYDETSQLLNEVHEMNQTMNTNAAQQPAFDWCLHDNYRQDAPAYSHDIYACPADLDDLDTFLQCDITDLDNYLHMPEEFVAASSASAVMTQPAPEVSVSVPCTSNDDLLEEFFPDLSPRRRNVSSSTASSGNNRAAPYEVSDYRFRRDKNNEASKRSRAKRAEKFHMSKQERADLEKRNIELRTTLAALEVQVADYKRMVLLVVGNK